MAAHFTPETLKFLRGLARHNDRDWFEPRREVYERALRDPMLALIDEINTGLQHFAPEHVRPGNKIMMRIYRDTRFSNNKLPYKKHLSAWWARRGMEKTSGGGFYLQVSPQGVQISAGVFMPEREQLLTLRRWMSEHHESYRKDIARLTKPRRGPKTDQPPFSVIEMDVMKRMPRGFAADHPADELLRSRNWGVQVHLPAEDALQPQFAARVIQRYKQASSLVDQLNRAILEVRTRPEPAARNLFRTPF